MTSSTPLTGIALIDCAKANAKSGIEASAQNCGYGNDHAQFLEAVQSACETIGVEINELQDLVSEQSQSNRPQGIEIAPDTPSDL